MNEDAQLHERYKPGVDADRPRDESGLSAPHWSRGIQRAIVAGGDHENEEGSSNQQNFEKAVRRKLAQLRRYMIRDAAGYGARMGKPTPSLESRAISTYSVENN